MRLVLVRRTNTSPYIPLDWSQFICYNNFNENVGYRYRIKLFSTIDADGANNFFDGADVNGGKMFDS